MKNLHAFDWKCYSCGYKIYQGPTPTECGHCKGKKIKRKMIWQPRSGVNSTSYCFDSTPHFQYFEDYKHREPYRTEKAEKRCTETMSLQGSFFMSTLENFWKWELSDEKLGNWGNQGIEVALATWLNGGKVLVNHDTWYAHMFRTQGGDFSFPWENKGRETERTKNNVWNKFKSNPKLKDHIRRFMPVADWSEEKIKML